MHYLILIQAFCVCTYTGDFMRLRYAFGNTVGTGFSCNIMQNKLLGLIDVYPFRYRINTTFAFLKLCTSWNPMHWNTLAIVLQVSSGFHKYHFPVHTIFPIRSWAVDKRLLQIASTTYKMQITTSVPVPKTKAKLGSTNLFSFLPSKMPLYLIFLECPIKNWYAPNPCGVSW